MGQYYKPVNLDKREYIHPHSIGNGLKMLEQTGWDYSVDVREPAFDSIYTTNERLRTLFGGVERTTIDGRELYGVPIYSFETEAEARQRWSDATIEGQRAMLLLEDRGLVFRRPTDACPRDTNGDGDCGRPLCPYCGPLRTVLKGSIS